MLIGVNLKKFLLQQTAQLQAQLKAQLKAQLQAQQIVWLLRKQQNWFKVDC